EVGHPDPHAIAEPHRHNVDAGEDTGVEGPDVELHHFCDLRKGGTGVEPIGTHDEDEVAIDATKLRILWVHDQTAHHPHRHLYHLVGVRVVHESAAALDLELVDEGLPRRDVRLRHPADAIHAVREQHAVPMDCGVLGQLIGDEDPHLVALDHLNGRARRLAVIAPKPRGHAG